MAKTEAAIHNQALQRFDDIIGKTKDEREQSLEDRRFCSIAGAQWEGDLNEQYENKAKFEVNKTALSVRRIISEYRKSRITVDFKGRDEASEKVASFLDSRYRYDEQESVANEAYDNAFQEGVKGGFGAWRLRNDYEDMYDDESAYQKICFEPIFDADSTVFFDLAAKRMDKSDAKFAFILTSYTMEDYEEEFGDDISGWQKEINGLEFDWVEDNSVYVAEYYTIETTKKTVYIYKDNLGNKKTYTEQDFEENPGLKTKLRKLGEKKVGEKKKTEKLVHKYKLSGSKILEDCGYIAGECIPIVPFYGDRCIVENIERFIGHVRFAKDAQRLKNMQLSKLAEIAALTPVEKPIFTPEQIAQHQTMWVEDNIKNYPFLLVDPVEDSSGNMVPQGAVDYTRSPNIPPALAAILQGVEQDMKEILGDHAQAEKVRSGISGDALEQIHDRFDMHDFIYMSNMGSAMKRSGEIYVSMAKDVYCDKGRELAVLDIDGESHKEELMVEKIDSEGASYISNDLLNTKFSLVVDVGPSSSTKKASTVKSLIAAAQVTGDPETMQLLSSAILMNLEGEGVNDIAEFQRRKLVKMGVMDPTEDDKKRLAQEAQAAAQQPDPTAEYLASEAEKNRAQAAKTVSEIEENKAQTIKTQAETAEIMAAIKRNDLDAVAKIMASRQPVVNSGETNLL